MPYPITVETPDGQTITASNFFLADSGGLAITGNPTTNTITFSGGGGSGNITLTGNTGGAVAPSSGGNLNVLGAGSVSVVGTPGTNTLTISLISTPSGITWVNNATSGAALSNHGYIVTAGTQTFTLPATPLVGDNIKFMLNGGSFWVIYLGGQSIKYLSAAGPVVYTNSVTSGNTDATVLSIICTKAVSPITWSADSGVGSVTGT